MLMITTGVLPLPLAVSLALEQRQVMVAAAAAVWPAVVLSGTTSRQHTKGPGTGFRHWVYSLLGQC